MDMTQILSHVDHTLLKPISTWDEIQQLCEEAIEHHMASVCVAPHYVAKIHQNYQKRLKICTVIGFPLGYNTTAAKVAEATQAIQNGADEIDMVVNLTDVKNGYFDNVTAEIKEIKHVAGDKVVKVIVETCYLTEEEKIAMCHSVTSGGADYIKTSTGFGTGGAQIADIELFKQHLGPNVKIKASGGVKKREVMEQFLLAGCDRIGTSSAVSNLNDTEAY